MDELLPFEITTAAKLTAGGRALYTVYRAGLEKLEAVNEIFNI